jgi:hypothetical protein
LTFTSDLDDLIRLGYGDVKRLRNIRDTIKHDNFIISEDKKYVTSLISMHLRNQPLDESEPRLEPKSTDSSSNSASVIIQQQIRSSTFSSNKKIGIFGGVAAAVAIIIIIGFSIQGSDVEVGSNFVSTSKDLILKIDESSYRNADIISISGNVISNSRSIELSIEDANDVKIWNEFVSPRNDGQFSTLVIAGGNGWENNGVYTLIAEQGDLENEIKFNFRV